MPCLQQLCSFARGDLPGPANFDERQSVHPHQPQWIEPELGRAAAFVHVYMRRFIALFRVEVKTRNPLRDELLAQSDYTKGSRRRQAKRISARTG